LSWISRRFAQTQVWPVFLTWRQGAFDRCASEVRQCVETMKGAFAWSSMEALFIVLDDCSNLIAAVRKVPCLQYRNTGQTCVCANRLLIQDKSTTHFAQAPRK